MEFRVYMSGSQYRWRLLASNNENIANSGESYINKSDCLSAIELVKGSSNAAVKDETAAPAAAQQR